MKQPEKPERDVEKASDKRRKHVGNTSELSRISPAVPIDQLPEYLGIAECARAIGYSRDQFHTLRKQGVFPEPSILIMTRKPVYHQSQVRTCRQIIATRIGFNGKPVMLQKRSSQDNITKPASISEPAKLKKPQAASKEGKSLAKVLKTRFKISVDALEVDRALQRMGPEIDRTQRPMVIRYLFDFFEQEESA